MAMEMKMALTGGGYMDRQQVMRLTPPIANTEEDIVANSRRERNGISARAMGEVRSYLASDNYSDAQVISAMSERGYNVTRSDVSFARALADCD